MPMNKLEKIRRRLKGATIFVMPYNHADIAWTHTRAWHVSRYVRILDEVLDVMKSHPEFRFFIDSWIEFLEPYLRLRPSRLKELRERVKEKRIAFTCGQFGNLRPTQVGDETFIRNLILGRRKIREMFPRADLSVFANLDVGIGHSQLPQLLQLAGCPYYFAWRPEAALDAQGVPRTFVWQGLSGQKVIVTRHVYGYLALGHNAEIEWEGRWPQTVEFIWERYLEKAAKTHGLDIFSFCVGGDDARPLRRWENDEPLDVPGLIKAWNREETSRMRFGTPVEFFQKLENKRDILPLWEGVLDSAEVCYNIAVSGGQGLWRIRQRADRALVEAEIWSSLAAMKGRKCLGGQIQSLWEELLSITPHAIQAAFEEDWQERRFLGENVIADAKRVADESIGKLLPAKVAVDAAGFAIVNPLPFERTEIVPIHIINTDLQQKGFALRTHDGKRLKMQVIRKENVAEFTALAEINVPSCGWSTVKLHFTKKPVYLSQAKKLSRRSAIVETDRMRLSFSGGRLLQIEDKRLSRVWNAHSGTSFLEPLRFAFEGSTWKPEKMDDRPQRFSCEEIRLDEGGPLRWRIMRRGMLGAHRVHQHIIVFARRAQMEVETEIFAAQDRAHIGLGVPLSKGASINVDIPFGVEKREIEKIPYGRFGDPYGGLERRIPGLFWGRSWVCASSRKTSLGLISVDGDRYFWTAESSRWLVHFLARMVKPAEEGWEAQTHLGKEQGYHRFRHVLVLGRGGWKRMKMVDFAQRIHHSVKSHPIGKDNISKMSSFLFIEPPSVHMSALYTEGKSMIMRLVQMDAKDVAARIKFLRKAQAVDCVDFEGRTLKRKISFKNKEISVKLNPWEIVTLRIKGMVR